MARTVGEGFQEYLRRLAPSAVEVDKRRSHSRTISTALAAEFPAYSELVVIGSHTRDSAIHIKSDVDYLAKLGAADVTWAGSRVSSRTILNRVKSTLDARFPRTPTWIDGPAVVVGFGQDGFGAVDVVPGVWVGTTATAPHYPVFEIPDGSGGWHRSAPQRHTKYLRDENERAGQKLAGSVRLLKAWKYAREPRIPVQGFHVEMLLAAEGTSVGVRSYQNCLLDALRLLRDRAGRSLQDPVGEAGWIEASATAGQRAALSEHARYAAEKATSAITAELAGKVDDAFYYWQLVFNRDFPSRR